MKTAWFNAAAVTALALLATGCAQPPSEKYSWGNYESSLYGYYKAPGDGHEFAQTLKAQIDDAERRGKKVPPGIYAEYGGLLLEAGDRATAAQYFQKEQSAWPESTALMTTMTRLASDPAGAPKNAPAQAAGGAAPNTSSGSVTPAAAPAPASSTQSTQPVKPAAAAMPTASIDPASKAN